MAREYSFIHANTRQNLHWTGHQPLATSIGRRCFILNSPIWQYPTPGSEFMPPSVDECWKTTSDDTHGAGAAQRSPRWALVWQPPRLTVFIAGSSSSPRTTSSFPPSRVSCRQTVCPCHASSPRLSPCRLLLCCHVSQLHQIINYQRSRRHSQEELQM